MENVITLDSQNVGSFLGPLASRYSYTPSLRGILDSLYRAACSSDNRYFILEGEIIRAAQSTEDGALQYGTDNRVLVKVEIPAVTPEQLEQARQMWSSYRRRIMLASWRGRVGQ
jgi:hypothetical protein